jgi:hypothetical protein
MKNVSTAGVIAAILFSFSACSKCYKCHNLCQTCEYRYSDTTLNITVCSDKLSEKYYIEYIDSLTSPSLGWTCVDAASNYSERFCESESKSAIELINKKESGMVCASD